MKEYRVVVYKEGIVTSILLGQAKVNPDHLADYLNSYARRGWRVVTMEREFRRTALFFHREAFLIVLERDVAKRAPAVKKEKVISQEPAPKQEKVESQEQPASQEPALSQEEKTESAA